MIELKLFFVKEIKMFKEFCSFYKGEKECPFEAEKGNAGKFWMAEQFVCEEYGRNVEKQVETDFYRMVAAYISKWAPYKFPELLREYLSKSNADEKMRAMVERTYL